MRNIYLGYCPHRPAFHIDNTFGHSFFRSGMLFLSFFAPGMLTEWLGIQLYLTNQGYFPSYFFVLSYLRYRFDPSCQYLLAVFFLFLITPSIIFVIQGSLILTFIFYPFQKMLVLNFYCLLRLLLLSIIYLQHLLPMYFHQLLTYAIEVSLLAIQLLNVCLFRTILKLTELWSLFPVFPHTDTSTTCLISA